MIFSICNFSSSCPFCLSNLLFSLSSKTSPESWRGGEEDESGPFRQVWPKSLLFATDEARQGWLKTLLRPIPVRRTIKGCEFDWKEQNLGNVTHSEKGYLAVCECVFLDENSRRIAQLSKLVPDQAVLDWLDDEQRTKFSKSLGIFFFSAVSFNRIQTTDPTFERSDRERMFEGRRREREREREAHFDEPSFSWQKMVKNNLNFRPVIGYRTHTHTHTHTHTRRVSQGLGKSDCCTRVRLPLTQLTGGNDGCGCAPVHLWGFCWFVFVCLSHAHDAHFRHQTNGEERKDRQTWRRLRFRLPKNLSKEEERFASREGVECLLETVNWIIQTVGHQSMVNSIRFRPFKEQILLSSHGRHLFVWPTKVKQTKRRHILCAQSTLSVFLLSIVGRPQLYKYNPILLIQKSCLSATHAKWWSTGWHPLLRRLPLLSRS